MQLTVRNCCVFVIRRCRGCPLAAQQANYRMERKAGAKTLRRSKLEFRSAGLLKSSAGKPVSSSPDAPLQAPAFLLAPLKRDRSGCTSCFSAVACRLRGCCSFSCRACDGACWAGAATAAGDGCASAVEPCACSVQSWPVFVGDGPNSMTRSARARCSTSVSSQRMSPLDLASRKFAHRAKHNSK